MKKIWSFSRFNERETLLDLMGNIDWDLVSIIQKRIPTGSNILELSCGNGADSLKLKQLGYNIKCTEFSDEYVNNAKLIGLDCIKHDTREPLPYGDRSFDLVYCRLGLHYFSEMELDKIFSELSRVGNSILISAKISDDHLNTGKIILSKESWYYIVSKYFNIELFNERNGFLYGNRSEWIEIFARI